MAALIVSAVVVLLVTMVAGKCQGEVFRVGEETGWTTINITLDFYKKWAASKEFNVGDTLLFKYNNNFHNVVRVSHSNFNSCNTTAPYFTWSTGNDSFVIRRPGHLYFLCGVPGHCQAGQKLDIRVSGPPSPAHGPSPQTSPPLEASSPRHSANDSAPAPAKMSDASSGSHDGWFSWNLWTAAAVAAAFVTC